MSRKTWIASICCAVLLTVLAVRLPIGKVEAQTSSSGGIQALPSFVPDPCQNASAVKSNVAINVVSATTTQLVALSGTTKVFVCGGFMTVGSSGTTAATALLEYGTGATCGTGTTALTGAMGTGTATATNDGEPIVIQGGFSTLTTASGNALCILTAGTTVNVQGWITFVQQ